jgi:heme exporter protein D
MVFIMLFDLAVPVYLFLRRDWYTRLFEHGDIASFLVWMHFILPLALYILYVFQILAARKILRGEADADEYREGRSDHRGQAKAILVVRALTIFTGMLLIEPDPAE